MATAPEPGVSRRAEEAEQATKQITIKIRDKTWRVVQSTLTFNTRKKVRESTGHSVAWWGRELDLDAICVLVWVARMQSGEPDLTLEQADAEFDWDVTPADLAVFEEDGDPEDPES